MGNTQNTVLDEGACCFPKGNGAFLQSDPRPINPSLLGRNLGNQSEEHAKTSDFPSEVCKLYNESTYQAYVVKMMRWKTGFSLLVLSIRCWRIFLKSKSTSKTDETPVSNFVKNRDIYRECLDLETDMESSEHVYLLI